MTRLFGALFVLILGWFGFLSTAEAAITEPVPSNVHAYEYDGHQNSSEPTLAITERGPPSRAHGHTTSNAVGRWSHGASARSGRDTTPTVYTYSDLAEAVQVAKTASASSEVTPGVQRTAARAMRSHVAAKTVDDLPTVNWGQQSKHFPGHPNFIPGRSTLTANPEVLIQRAGTGTPVSGVPRGQAGFKERIDFGDNIGTYVSRDGTSSPTSIGILHYRADGSVHIIPGRPQ